MTTKFKVPKNSAKGTVMWLWDTFWADDPVEGQSILEDLPVSHTKQLVNFFHYCAEVGDKALSRSPDDAYQDSEGGGNDKN